MELFLGILLGIIISYSLWYFNVLIKFMKEQNLILSKFESIDLNQLKFNKRFNEFVYFSLNDNFLFLDLKNKSITLFDKKSNKYYFSVSLNTNMTKNLYNNISEKFKSNIEDIIEIQGYIYSKNTFNEFNQVMTDILGNFSISKEQEMSLNKEPMLNLDLILDKINSNGLKSLTKDELEFLQKQK